MRHYCLDASISLWINTSPLCQPNTFKAIPWFRFPIWFQGVEKSILVKSSPEFFIASGPHWVFTFWCWREYPTLNTRFLCFLCSNNLFCLLAVLVWATHVLPQFSNVHIKIIYFFYAPPRPSFRTYVTSISTVILSVTFFNLQKLFAPHFGEHFFFREERFYSPCLPFNLVWEQIFA